MPLRSLRIENSEGAFINDVKLAGGVGKYFCDTEYKIVGNMAISV